MNFVNFMAFFRGLKNVPTTAAGERVHSEYDVGQGKLYRMASITEKVSISGSSAAMTSQLPAGSRVLFAGAINIGAVTMVTSVKLGIGAGVNTNTAGLGLSTTVMTDGAIFDTPSADANNRFTAAATVSLNSVDTAGASAGSATGVAKVRILYEYVQAQIA